MSKKLKSKEELINILIQITSNSNYLDQFEGEKNPVIKITCTVWGEQIYPFTRDVGPAEYAEDEYTVEYNYDRDDLCQFLYDTICDDLEITEQVYELDSGATLTEFIEKFISSLSSVYSKDIEENFYDDAAEQAQEEYDEELESRRADAEVDRYESSLEDREQDYYDRVSDLYW